jgi:pimeloyl-ACP methyl ester carboxylesterase
MTAPPRRRRRARRIAGWAVGVAGAVVVIAAAALLVWSQVGVMAAEPEPLAAVTDDPAIDVHDDGTAMVLSPAEGGSGQGLVFIPGAKVQAEAYAAKLSGAVTELGMTVVITKPWLNLAFFDPRGLSTFTDLAPGVEEWAVGGHSLGGVRACQLAPDADALVLFASYCANDLAGSGLPALSISGSEDGLSTPQKIQDARGELPADAVFVEIAGAAHSSFGDYGAQAGDGTPDISDADMTADLTDALAAFFG